MMAMRKEIITEVIKNTEEVNVKNKFNKRKIGTANLAIYAKFSLLGEVIRPIRHINTAKFGITKLTEYLLGGNIKFGISSAVWACNHRSLLSLVESFPALFMWFMEGAVDNIFP